MREIVFRANANVPVQVKFQWFEEWEDLDMRAFRNPVLATLDDDLIFEAKGLDGRQYRWKLFDIRIKGQKSYVEKSQGVMWIEAA